jgi:3-methyladenine DNA glycosylase AlkD
VTAVFLVDGPLVDHVKLYLLIYRFAPMPPQNPPPPSPEELAVLALRRLEALADPATAARGALYFKPPLVVNLYGVRAPQVRSLVREFHGQVGGRWSVDDALLFCDTMTADSHLEAKFLGVLVLGKYSRALPGSLLRKLERWIREGRFASWAAIDTVAPELITQLVRRYPDSLARIESWTSSRSLWLRRAAVVTFVPLARKGERLDVAYRLVESLFDDQEDLMHKACGWLLREAGKTNATRLERFLLRHGPRIPRTTVRYAIERFPERKRKALLRRTKGK